MLLNILRDLNDVNNNQLHRMEIYGDVSKKIDWNDAANFNSFLSGIYIAEVQFREHAQVFKFNLLYMDQCKYLIIALSCNPAHTVKDLTIEWLPKSIIDYPKKIPDHFKGFDV